MKKLGIIAALIILFGAGLFFWLVSQSAPSNADTTTITVDIPDNFEE